MPVDPDDALVLRHEELLREPAAEEETRGWDFGSVRGHCVFTTHTPVPAGHDQFSYDTARELLGEEFPLEFVQMLAGRIDST